MKKITRHVLLVVLCGFIMAACQKNCGKPVDTHEVDKGPAAKIDKPSRVKNLAFDGLSEAQIDSVNALVEKGQLEQAKVQALELVKLRNEYHQQFK